ncbi:MAG: mannose-1-phosphate guanylyltransferase [Treponema sp.]|jgi:mannose-1-phosphate guanylyltransferase/mannose-1-phosphate guanylyltransferase/mannose-6-phosphate isomerase|nr:mannose-1-phosphate guanylyltransferase [Treponema sp.]
MFDDCIIMAGGSGTRLWPASSSKRPKQFLGISRAGGKSFFSAALERALSVTDPSGGRVIIIAGRGHEEHIIAACASLGAEEMRRLVLIPEPEAKNTAPAIACGVTFTGLMGGGPERNMLVLTSDHIIRPPETFRLDAEAASRYARQDRLAVFGITPSKPETGYGYIEAAEGLPARRDGGEGRVPAEPGACAVSSFREKPDRETAERFVASKNFYWNSGMFAFSSKFILGEYRRHAPDLIRSFEMLRAPDESSFTVKQGLRVLDAWPGLKDAYGAAESISFDYAIAEKCGAVVMIRAGFDWIDVGNWDEYSRLAGNTAAEVYLAGSENCFVDADIPVAIAGAEDLIVVVRSGRDGGPPAVLIARKGETQRVRDIVEQIRQAGRTELL